MNVIDTVAVEHAPATGLASRDLVDAHRIARHATLTNPAAYADDLAAVDAAPTAIAVYRLAADLRDRAEAVASLPVQGPVDDPFVCGHCQFRFCRATHMVFCAAREGGDAVYVGERCAEAAARFMDATAVYRVNKVRIDELDSDDYRWLLDTARVAL